MAEHITRVTISLPNWFYGTSTAGIIGIIAYLAILHHQIKNLCKDHPKIQQSLVRISEILLQKKMAADIVYTMSASPVQLTDEGKKALIDAGFDTFYEKNKNTLIERVKEKNPKSVADLEESCKGVMLSIEDTLPSFDSIKKFAYNNGEPISRILFASAIALRDKLKDELNIRE